MRRPGYLDFARIKLLVQFGFPHGGKRDRVLIGGDAVP